MGGCGSGRWSWHRRKTQVEECYKLSIFSLKRYLIPGLSSNMRWLRGEEEYGSIGFHVQGNNHPTAIRLKYSKNSLGLDFDYVVALTTTSLPWGGERYWFVCPLQGCFRRVSCLYLPPGGKYFGCRHCYDLGYRSQTDYHTDKRMFAYLAASMRDEFPGITGEELKSLLDDRFLGASDRRYSEAYWRAVERREKRERYLNTEELCQQSGLTPESLKKLEEARLLIPDTKNGRYRPKLAGWGKKLAYLLDQGWELEEIKRWAKGRFRTNNPRQWPPEGMDWQ